eukprot:CAMPEP_0196667024 /NCGR_PEP_ID=MMETSP1086-20130531/64850_1 /TAXON_ID=77921 /ORGANISM="Cyanoptyche  gloeocystis , Strain SAG4.97" /LENGTH=169 /DNA_ID=CAMNT_0042004303 /DNA_START=1056 /DNA_END=1565 /DNA_ORIENTATION=+
MKVQICFPLVDEAFGLAEVERKGQQLEECKRSNTVKQIEGMKRVGAGEKFVAEDGLEGGEETTNEAEDCAKQVEVDVAIGGKRNAEESRDEAELHACGEVLLEDDGRQGDDHRRDRRVEDLTKTDGDVTKRRIPKYHVRHEQDGERPNDICPFLVKLSYRNTFGYRKVR